jgi:DNA-binding NarL/FixJ family response regulator
MESVQKTSVNCDRPNLTKCDHCVLNLLRPHLMQFDENNPMFSQIQQILAQIKQILNQDGVIILGIDEQVQFMTQQAEYLLNEYFSPYIPFLLPESLQRWFKHQISQPSFDSDVFLPCLSLNIEKEAKELVINLILDPTREQYILLLKEKEILLFSIDTLALLGLSQRETEVLFGVAQDKNNTEISKVLSCSEGTVRKHLENIYKKLGVQTRLGAVMFALEKLGLIKK